MTDYRELSCIALKNCETYIVRYIFGMVSNVSHINKLIMFSVEVIEKIDQNIN